MRPHRALLIVDVQQAFAPPPAFLHQLGTYAARFPCRVFTRFVNPPGSLFRRSLGQRSCAPGTSDLDLLLPPRAGDLILNKIGRYGLSPHQLRRLRARRIRRVIVCGLDTDACVLAVMFSLFDAGIECHLKEDLCWSSSGLHTPALRIIRSQFPPPR